MRTGQTSTAGRPLTVVDWPTSCWRSITTLWAGPTRCSLTMIERHCEYVLEPT
ncbi:MAG: hypothetical protein JWR32_201 [Mycobacterium sp.]|nr:hypothetical protein [Mycobacterium sp.]